MEEKNIIEELLKREETPEFKELVVVKITQFTPYGVFCDLLEYKDVKGFIPLTEISRKRIKKITEVVRIGMVTVGRVLEVKGEKEVDISLRRVDENEKKKKLNEYRLEKRLANLFYIAAKNTNLDFDKLKLVINYIFNKYGSLYYFVEEYRKKGDIIINRLKELEVDNTFIANLKKELDNYIGKLKEKISGIIKIYSLARDGAKRIKEALIEIKERLNKEKNIEKLEIEYKSSPEWYIFFETDEKKKTVNKLKEIINEISKKYQKKGVYIEISI